MLANNFGQISAFRNEVKTAFWTWVLVKLALWRSLGECIFSWSEICDFGIFLTIDFWHSLGVEYMLFLKWSGVCGLPKS
ncbi:unnamed protein product [Rhizophagus irregularis]|nr:unnamed protein product [Rhizophagus irregularis]